MTVIRREIVFAIRTSILFFRRVSVLQCRNDYGFVEDAVIRDDRYDFAVIKHSDM